MSMEEISNLMLKHNENNLVPAVSTDQCDNTMKQSSILGIIEENVGVSNEYETNECSNALIFLKKYGASTNVSERQSAVRHLVKTLQNVEDDENSVRDIFYLIQQNFADDSDPVIRGELLEQIPLLALHCSQTPNLYQYKQTILLPLLLKFLNDTNSQVRKTSQTAVSILVEQDLLTIDDIELSLFPVLLRLSMKDYNSEDIRIESVGLLCKLVSSLGRDKTIKLFLTRFTELCVDSLFHIRKTCASHLGEISKVLGRDLTEKVIVPHLIALSQDGVWGVRKACAECFPDVSNFCSMQTRRHHLAPIFIVLLADSSRWVQSAAFQALGPFISTFADFSRTGLQWVDGQLQYDEYQINDTLDRASPTSVATKFLITSSGPLSIYTSMPTRSRPAGQLPVIRTVVTTPLMTPHGASLVSVSGDDDSSAASMTSSASFSLTTCSSSSISNDLLTYRDALVDFSLGSNLVIFNSNIAQMARQRLDENRNQTIITAEMAGQETVPQADTIGIQGGVAESGEKAACQKLAELHIPDDDETGMAPDESTLVAPASENEKAKLFSSPSSASSLSSAKVITCSPPTNADGFSADDIELDSSVDTLPQFLEDAHRSLLASDSLSDTSTYMSFKFWQPKLPETLPLMDDGRSPPASLAEPLSTSGAILGGSGTNNADSNGPAQDEAASVQSFMERHLRFSAGLTSPTDDTPPLVTPATTISASTYQTTSGTEPVLSTTTVPTVPHKPIVSTHQATSPNRFGVSHQLIECEQQAQHTSIGAMTTTFSTPTLSLTIVKHRNKVEPETDPLRSVAQVHRKPPYCFEDSEDEEGDVALISSNLLYQQNRDRKDSAKDAVEDQDVIPQALLDQFLSMVEPSRSQAIEGDMPRHCAFSFPAVTFTMGRRHWPLMKPAYLALANDMQWKVRRTLAFSIHNLAEILGTEITTRDLLPVFTGFLRDLDEVRIGILKNLAAFLKLLEKNVRTSLLSNLADFLQTENFRNWRFRHLFAEQLVLLCDLFDIEDINDYLSPIAMTLAIDKVAEIRQVTHKLLATILIHFYRTELAQNSGSMPITDTYIQDIVKSFAKSQRWIRRQTFIYICHEIVRMEALPVSKFANDIAPHLMALSRDTIPNVRIVLANVLSSCMNSGDYFSSSTATMISSKFNAAPSSPNFNNDILLDQLHQVMKRLSDDKDRDVRQAAQKHVTLTADYHSPPLARDSSIYTQSSNQQMMRNRDGPDSDPEEF